MSLRLGFPPLAKGPNSPLNLCNSQDLCVVILEFRIWKLDVDVDHDDRDYNEHDELALRLEKKPIEWRRELAIPRDSEKRECLSQ